MATIAFYDRKRGKEIIVRIIAKKRKQLRKQIIKISNLQCQQEAAESGDVP